MDTAAEALATLVGHLPNITTANSLPQLVDHVSALIDIINHTPLKIGVIFIDYYDPS